MILNNEYCTDLPNDQIRLQNLNKIFYDSGNLRRAFQKRCRTAISTRRTDGAVCACTPPHVGYGLPPPTKYSGNHTVGTFLSQPWWRRHRQLSTNLRRANSAVFESYAFSRFHVRAFGGAFTRPVCSYDKINRRESAVVFFSCFSPPVRAWVRSRSRLRANNKLCGKIVDVSSHSKLQLRRPSIFKPAGTLEWRRQVRQCPRSTRDIRRRRRRRRTSGLSARARHDRGSHDTQRGVQEVLAQHIQQVEMHQLLQAEGGTQRRGFGEQPGECEF